jgi:tRNA(fMet)-specific endonuclease VapC
MNLLLDSNILIYLSRDSSTDFLNNFVNPQNKEVYLSIVSVAEVRSISVKNNWGEKKTKNFDRLVNAFSIIEISEYLIHSYVEIDTFSQRKNPNFPTYNFDTPRNMEKNDLWVASTAAILGLELVTTDTDFAHLHNVFLDVRQINQEDLRQYFY